MFIKQIANFDKLSYSYVLNDVCYLKLYLKLGFNHKKFLDYRKIENKFNVLEML